MKTFLQNLGAILLLCGVLCLAVYAIWVPSNTLLAASLVLEVVGLAGYICANRCMD